MTENIKNPITTVVYSFLCFLAGFASIWINQIVLVEETKSWELYAIALTLFSIGFCLSWVTMLGKDATVYLKIATVILNIFIVIAVIKTCIALESDSEMMMLLKFIAGVDLFFNIAMGTLLVIKGNVALKNID
ncbi:MAG: hypothetical protein WC180_04865 [Candidatus Paceibacterota bacterium]|jgi:hypothetical protein